MLFTSKLALSIAVSFCALVSAQTDVAASVAANCKGRVVTSESFIGKDKNVKMETFSCADAASKRSVNLDARQSTNNTIVCGAACNIFGINNGTNNTVALSFRSCETFFVNQDIAPLSYCRIDWAGVVDFVAPNCQATQNAHGGNCVANDQRWFVQVQHA
ncbi:hypothetical protein BD779DRAFT_1742022 [Infundibulicybe gibba]|nr:hypothetical protein BD779DRAFT_1742022 [Infundibulicybe gibba]